MNFCFCISLDGLSLVESLDFDSNDGNETFLKTSDKGFCLIKKSLVTKFNYKFSLHAQNIQVIFWSPFHLHIVPLLSDVVLHIVKLNMDFEYEPIGFINTFIH